MEETVINEAVEAFIECPENYFYEIDGTFYEWATNENGFGTTSLNNIDASYKNITIGYVQNITFIGQIATIGHISTNSDLTRRRLGTALARALARNFSARFGITTIHFDEIRIRDDRRRMYELFLTRLGAIEIPGRNFVWEWNFNENDIVL